MEASLTQMNLKLSMVIILTITTIQKYSIIIKFNISQQNVKAVCFSVSLALAGQVIYMYV